MSVFLWLDSDNRLLRQMGIAPVEPDFDEDVTPSAETLREMKTPEYRAKHPILYPVEVR